MKKFFSALLLLASVLALPALAGDSTTSGNGEFTSILAESAAFATLRGGDGGCIETEVDVYASKAYRQINQEKGTTNLRVYVNSMTRRNVCTNTLEFSASGDGPVTSFAHGEGTASVAANIQVVDTVSGNSVPVWINLAWNAFGVRTDFNSEEKETYPEGFYNIRGTRYTSIVSSATGSVSDGAYEYASQYQSATWAQVKLKFRTNAAAQ